MNNPFLLAALALLTIASVVVICAVVRSVWREMKAGLGHDEEAQRQRRTEERKNERIRRELETWREGR